MYTILIPSANGVFASSSLNPAKPLSKLSTTGRIFSKTDFAPVSSVIYDAAYDIRYYSDNNFTGTRIKGYNAPVAYMTKESLKALAVAAEILRKHLDFIDTYDAKHPDKTLNQKLEESEDYKEAYDWVKENTIRRLDKAVAAKIDKAFAVLNKVNDYANKALKAQINKVPVEERLAAYGIIDGTLGKRFYSDVVNNNATCFNCCFNCSCCADNERHFKKKTRFSGNNGKRYV